jgi:hypothetical protein
MPWFNSKESQSFIPLLKSRGMKTIRRIKNILNKLFFEKIQDCRRRVVIFAVLGRGK